MTYHESHRREKRSFWLGILIGSALWTLIALAIVLVFEVFSG